MNQVRIISELEKEKKKMQDDVSKLKEAKVTYFTQAVDLFFLRSCQRTFSNTVLTDCCSCRIFFVSFKNLCLHFLAKPRKDKGGVPGLF